MRLFLVKLAVQLRVIRALVIREMMTRFGRHSLGFFWVMGESLILCLIVMAAWTLAEHKLQDGVGIIPFVLSGYTLLSLWRHVVGRSVHCFRGNSGLMFHRNVHYIDTIIARSLLEIVGIGIAFWIAYIPFFLLGIMEPIYEPRQVIGGWLLLGWFSFSLALVLAGLSEMVEIVERLVQPFMYVTLPLTGMFFMISWVPERMGKVVSYSPVANCFEMFRGGILGHTVDARWDAAYVAKCSLILTALGLMVLQRARHHISAD